MAPQKERGLVGRNMLLWPYWGERLGAAQLLLLHPKSSSILGTVQPPLASSTWMQGTSLRHVVLEECGTEELFGQQERGVSE